LHIHFKIHLTSENASFCKVLGVPCALAFEGVVSSIIQIEVALAFQITGENNGIFSGRTVLVLAFFYRPLDIF